MPSTHAPSAMYYIFKVFTLIIVPWLMPPNFFKNHNLHIALKQACQTQTTVRAAH